MTCHVTTSDYLKPGVFKYMWWRGDKNKEKYYNIYI